MANIFDSEEVLVRMLNYYPLIFKLRDKGMLPPKWVYRLGAKQQQAIKNVPDQDFINIICTPGRTKNQQVDMMVDAVDADSGTPPYSSFTY